MHVADLTMFWAPRGGGVRRFLEAKQAWGEANGWQISRIVPGPLSSHAGTGGLHGVPAVPMPFSGGYRWPLGTGSARRLLRQLAPDLVEADDPFTLGRAALDASREAGIPAVAFCHTDLPAVAARLVGGPAFATGSPVRQCLARATERLAAERLRRLYAGFDAVLAPSRFVAQRLAGLGLSNVVVQPLGVDTRCFRPVPADGAWRARLGIAPDARLLLAVGRWAPEKNLAVLADAVRRLGPPWVLVAVGAGPCPPSGARVVRVPFEPDSARLAVAYASADLLVHAGDRETFGLAALEAMACGLPVLALGGTAMAELVDDEVGGIVPRLDADLYAQAARELVAQERAGLRGPRSAAARRRAECHDWQRVLAILFARYRALVERAPAPDARLPLGREALP